MDSLPPYVPASGKPVDDNLTPSPLVDSLPDYDGSSYIPPFVHIPRINDKLQSTYRIGTQHTPPLVEASDLHAHLVLLGAFHRLREEVRTQKGNANSDTPDQLWAVFLERAVHRFELWVTKMIDVLAEEEASAGQPPPSDGFLDPDRIPPLDVIMVWHTYLLNPSDYYEDCLRLHRGLLRIGYVDNPDRRALLH